MPARCALSSASAISIACRSACVERQRASRQASGERLALEDLHDQEGDVTFTSDVVQRADVRMIECGDRPRFPFEPLAQLLVRRERSGEHLDRDHAVEPCIARAIHLAHAACPEQADDFVRA